MMFHDNKLEDAIFFPEILSKLAQIHHLENFHMTFAPWAQKPHVLKGQRTVATRTDAAAAIFLDNVLGRKFGRYKSLDQ